MKKALFCVLILSGCSSSPEYETGQMFGKPIEHLNQAERCRAFVTIMQHGNLSPIENQMALEKARNEGCFNAQPPR